MSKFTSCLSQGQFYERETLKYIEYDTYKFSVGKCKEWDIEVYKHGVPLYYEVKSETNAFKYGNLCIEYEYNEGKSGIDATIADYWVHYAINDKAKNIYSLFIIPTAELRQMIINKKYLRKITGGDRNLSKCYLFRMTELSDYNVEVIHDDKEALE
jgi:hypothetical protein